MMKTDEDSQALHKKCPNTEFSSPYFPVFELSADQKNSVFRQFSRSEVAEIALKFLTDCKSLLSPK